MERHALAKSFASGERDAAAVPAYWSPAIGFLHRPLSLDYRVEAVDTVDHWAAACLPEAGIPLVRGWFRRVDFPGNAILYHRFGARGYVRWLRNLGVRYVVQTDSPPGLQRASRRRVALERPHGPPGRLSLGSRDDLRGAASAPARHRARPGSRHGPRESQIRLSVRAPGRYRVAVRYSPYWSGEKACVEAGANGLVRLIAKRPGPVDLRFTVGPTRMLKARVGDGRRQCS